MSAKVLVIDDSSLIRTMVGRTLTGAGYQVVQAVDGVDGLEKLGANADVCLVICDVNMPKMSGVEFLEAVASGPRKGVPVVILTTEQDPAMMARAKSLGAKGWMVKPFKPGTLLAAASSLTKVAPANTAPEAKD